MNNRRRDRANQLIVGEVSVDFTEYTLSSSTHEHEQRKRENCYRHSQRLERSQLSNRGRNRAIQLIVVEVSVDFTENTLPSSAHEHEQYKQRKRENCNRHSQDLERSQLSD